MQERLTPTAAVKLAGEFLGTLFLVATVVGSGIMAAKLAGGNEAVALLGNTLATGVMLTVLITVIRSLSGAHLNPAVSVALCMRGELRFGWLMPYVVAQIVGGIFGTWLAHLMFDVTVFQTSTNLRLSLGTFVAEIVATFGLVAAILGTLRINPNWIGPMVGLYVSGAYWFTSSTSFANPAVTLARSMSDSFTGIAPVDVLPFIGAQLIGAIIAAACFGLLDRSSHVKPQVD
ncbi:MAG: aquaporin family protein [Gammaproteobacteria bacterium]|nr:aquaporin family protein [Gammaproteobacteria bacterium]